MAGGGAGSGGTTVGGSAGTGVVERPFWCDEYRAVEASQREGWVSINPSVVNRGAGNMTSPIQSCTGSGASWSVTASGTEEDGIDTTTMSFQIAGGYHGPGRYPGKLADGISVSFSHSDLDVSFASVASSECEICVNDDGLSGTVQCRALESPLGSALELAHIPSGQFTCTGAAVKPSSAATTTRTFTSYSGSTWLCHYLEQLGCPEHTPPDSCVRTHDIILIDGPCSPETSAWQGCIGRERPSQLSCADYPGDDLVTATGGCETERTAMRDCRILAGAGGNGSTGVETSAECDAFCNKLLAQCGVACSRSICRVDPDQCADSTKAFLACLTEDGHVTCGDSGVFTYTGCPKDNALCSIAN
jgi:hypothetical protein